MVNIVNLPPPPPAMVTNHSTETKANENRLILFESPVSLGSKNDQVKALQEELKLVISKGRAMGNSADILNTLRSFQRVNGLPEDEF